MKNHQNKQSKTARVPVTTGMHVVGRIMGFEVRNGRRAGAVLMFPGKDTGFLSVNKVDALDVVSQQARLERLLVGDLMRVRVTERFEPNNRQLEAKPKRRVSCNERNCRILEGMAEHRKGEKSVLIEGQEAVVIRKTDGAGVRVRITSEGAAFGLESFAHFHDLPGGLNALRQLTVGSKLVVDVKNPRVNDKDQVIVTVDLFGPQRRELESRFPAGVIVSAEIRVRLTNGFGLSLKSGERAFLADTELGTTHPTSMRIKTSTNAFVIGVDKFGVLLLSKRDPSETATAEPSEQSEPLTGEAA